MDDLRERLRRLEAKATPMDLTDVELREEGEYECPCCQGEGYVDGEQFINIDGLALNVMFSGIGDQFGANRDFVMALIEAYRSGQLVPAADLEEADSGENGRFIGVEGSGGRDA